MKRASMIKQAFMASLPVMAGYLALGAGFGILMSAHGFQVITAFFMSLFVYAGSLQYVAVQLLSEQAGFIAIALTSFLVNIRHIFYGISLIDHYRGAGWKKLYMMFALTDETYSLIVADHYEGKNKLDYYFYISLLNHVYWIAGGVIGALIGKYLVFDWQGIDFVLTALFVTIVVDQVRQNRQFFLLSMGLGIPLMCLLVFGANHFLIPALMALVITLLLFEGRIIHGSK